MANLGDNNTPVEGESFGLPSGFSIDENSGNLAIRDTNGNVVAEWDETNTQWDFANNTLANVDALNSNSVRTGGAKIDDTFYFSSTFDGSNATERLNNAMSEAAEGSVIYLENAVYDSVTVEQNSIRLVGTSNSNNNGSLIGGDETWTVASTGVMIQNIGQFLSDANIQVNDDRVTLSRIYGRGDVDISINGDDAMINLAHLSNITFESDTSDGIVDTSTRVSVTDNGENTIGDIA